MQRIEVNDIRVYAYHGCLPEEASIGGNYLVSITVDTDFSASFTSDALRDTVDYVAVNEVVETEMAIRANLIEQVGYRIVKKIKALDQRIIRVGVRLVKLSPPINGDVASVAVWIEE